VLTGLQVEVINLLGELPHAHIAKATETYYFVPGASRVEVEIIGGCDAETECDHCGSSRYNYMSVRARWRGNGRFQSAVVRYDKNGVRRVETLRSVSDLKTILRSFIKAGEESAA
jgi:hypothetical protein